MAIQMGIAGQNYSTLTSSRYNSLMLPELELNDTLRLRKPHPCGSFDWKVTRLGADIGLECLGCGRRIMLTRRELKRRLKKILPQETKDED
jgi:hypothetical protein